MVFIRKSLLAFTSLLALASAAVSGSGTTSSSSSSSGSCNPLSSSSCPADKALATDIAEDFSTNSSYFEIKSTASGVSYGDDGLALSLKKRYDNPSLKSKFYIMFGRIEVHLKAANGTGIVSSFYLQSDDLDEIDIELLGGDDTQFQSNFFSKGNTTTYDRGEYHTVLGDSPQTAFHNYTIDWSEEECVWYLDGDAVRTLKNTSSQGYPQTPMYIMTGIWAGGDPSNDAGTIEWAGGETDYSDAPFTMYIKDLIVSDYSTGKDYYYSNQSGDWSSIKADDGEINGRINEVNIKGGEDTSTSEFSSSSTVSSSSSESKSSKSNSEASATTNASSESSDTGGNGTNDSSSSASTSLEAEATTASSNSDSLKKDSSSSSATASVTENSSNNSGSGYTISSILIGLSIMASTIF